MDSSRRFVDEEVMNEELNINNQNEAIQTKKIIRKLEKVLIQSYETK